VVVFRWSFYWKLGYNPSLLILWMTCWGFGFKSCLYYKKLPLLVSGSKVASLPLLHVPTLACILSVLQIPCFRYMQIFANSLFVLFIFHSFGSAHYFTEWIQIALTSCITVKRNNRIFAKDSRISNKIFHAWKTVRLIALTRYSNFH